MMPEFTASIVGALVFVLLGVLIHQVRSGLTNVGKEVAGVKGSVDQLNGRLYDHVTKSSVHEAGIAKVQEQVKYAENIGKTAHKRLDQLG